MAQVGILVSDAQGRSRVGAAGDLGEYIFGANPYEAGLPPAKAWDSWPPKATVTLETDPKKAAEQFILDPSDSELEEEPGQWKFKYADHYVERGLRVPYLYYRKSEADPSKGILVKDYFLIGFEGGGAY
jgi:hypothetical protein